MFYLRLNKVKILKKREFLGRAEIQFMSFVTSGESDFPMLDDFFTSNDAEVKNELIKQAVSKIVSSRVMPQIQKIRNRQAITFGNNGYIVYKSEQIPQDFNWMLMAIESDGKTRSNAELLSGILTEKNITSIAGALATLASLSNPVSAAITTLSTIVAQSLTTIFKNDKDDQVCSYHHSLKKRTILLEN
jgi:hypothetical protein